jgi:hypothetical protein
MVVVSQAAQALLHADPTLHHGLDASLQGDGLRLQAEGLTAGDLAELHVDLPRFALEDDDHLPYALPAVEEPLHPTMPSLDVVGGPWAVRQGVVPHVPESGLESVVGERREATALRREPNIKSLWFFILRITL